MRSEQSLWQLVRSLSKAEKSFFRKKNLRSSDPYLRLFRSYENAAHFEEEKIKLHAGYVRTGAFAAAKHYLFHSILDALILQGAENPSQAARRELDRAMLLFERSIFRACLKHIERGKALARSREDHLLMFEALNLEQLVWQFIAPSQRRDLELILQEKNMLLENIRFTEHARQLNARMLVLFQTIGVGRTKEDEEKYQSLFQEATQILEHPAPHGTITGGVYLLNCLVYYYNVKGDLDSSRHNLEALISLIDEHPGTLPSSFTFYVSSLNNLILVHLYLRQFGSAEKLIHKLNALHSDSIKDQNALFICRYNTGFELFEKMEEPERAFELSEALHEEYPRFARRLSPLYTGHLLYYAFRAAFQTGRLKKAQSWLNEILHHSVEAKPEVMAITRISELILAYERGHFHVLESLVRRAERHFERMGSMLKFERIMLHFFKEHAHHEASGSAWEALSKEIRLLAEDPMEQKVFMYFDVGGWIKRKRERSSGRANHG